MKTKWQMLRDAYNRVCDKSKLMPITEKQFWHTACTAYERAANRHKNRKRLTNAQAGRLGAMARKEKLKGKVANE